MASNSHSAEMLEYRAWVKNNLQPRLFGIEAVEMNMVENAFVQFGKAGDEAAWKKEAEHLFAQILAHRKWNPQLLNLHNQFERQLELRSYVFKVSEGEALLLHPFIEALRFNPSMPTPKGDEPVYNNVQEMLKQAWDAVLLHRIVLGLEKIRLVECDESEKAKLSASLKKLGWPDFEEQAKKEFRMLIIYEQKYDQKYKQICYGIVKERCTRDHVHMTKTAVDAAIKQSWTYFVQMNASNMQTMKEEKVFGALKDYAAALPWGTKRDK